MSAALLDPWFQTVLTTVGLTLLALATTDLWGWLKRTVRRRFQPNRQGTARDKGGA